MRAATEVRRRICVFCGAHAGRDAAYAEGARALGAAIAREGRTLVYGGGDVGLMGVVADAALAAGGEVIGVIPQALVDREIAHRGVTTLHVVQSMHERKQLMADLADAFVVLPGGIGTLEEFFEIWTWGQLGLHGKPYGILNVAGYYDALLDFLAHAEREGFIRAAQRGAVAMEVEPAVLLARLDVMASPEVPPVIARGDS